MGGAGDEVDACGPRREASTIKLIPFIPYEHGCNDAARGSVNGGLFHGWVSLNVPGRSGLSCNQVRILRGMANWSCRREQGQQYVLSVCCISIHD